MSARQVFLAARIHDLKMRAIQNQLPDVGQRDVDAGLRIVQPAVRVLLDQPGGGCHEGVHDQGKGRGTALSEEEKMSCISSDDNRMAALLRIAP